MVPPVLLQTRNKKPATISYFRAGGAQESKEEKPATVANWLGTRGGSFLVLCRGVFPGNDYQRFWRAAGMFSLQEGKR